MLVATFNQKNSYSPSAANWIKRADATIELIRKQKLDVIGTQEMTPKTKAYLERKLQEYIFVGRTRGSIGITDEYNCILLKREIFQLLDEKTYSLSNDINKVGSKFILDSFPRICTLAHVVQDEEQYLIINTHLDNVFEKNRKLQLEVLSKVIKFEKKPEERVIIIGDFNMKLTGDLEKFRIKYKLIDALSSDLGSSFRTIKKSEPIDHILISEELDFSETEIIKNKYNGVYPSDHYPSYTKIHNRKD